MNASVASNDQAYFAAERMLTCSVVLSFLPLSLSHSHNQILFVGCVHYLRFIQSVLQKNNASICLEEKIIWQPKWPDTLN